MPSIDQINARLRRDLGPDAPQVERLVEMGRATGVFVGPAVQYTARARLPREAPHVRTGLRLTAALDRWVDAAREAMEREVAAAQREGLRAEHARGLHSGQPTVEGCQKCEERDAILQTAAFIKSYDAQAFIEAAERAIVTMRRYADDVERELERYRREALRGDVGLGVGRAGEAAEGMVDIITRAASQTYPGTLGRLAARADVSASRWPEVSE